MQQRSPGQRTQGLLAINKHKAPLRHERALPKVVAGVPILPPNLTPPLFDFVAPPLPMKMATLYAVPIGPLALTASPPPVLPFAGTPGILIPPGTSADIPTPPVTPPPVGTPPVVTPAVVTPSAFGVPEPDTWAMMLLGFGLMGWRLRRRLRHQAIAG